MIFLVLLSVLCLNKNFEASLLLIEKMDEFKKEQ